MSHDPPSADEGRLPSTLVLLPPALAANQPSVVLDFLEPPVPWWRASINIEEAFCDGTREGASHKQGKPDIFNTVETKSAGAVKRPQADDAFGRLSSGRTGHDGTANTMHRYKPPTRFLAILSRKIFAQVRRRHRAQTPTRTHQDRIGRRRRRARNESSDLRCPALLAARQDQHRQRQITRRAAPPRRRFR